ncbi:MAG: serine hydrolase domain-containing protein [Reyranella sp.]
MRRVLLFAMVAAFFAVMPPAHAQTVDGIERAWRSWAAKYGQRTGAMVILHAGQPVREVAMGRPVAGAAVPLASLSKAITGVCIANLIDRGRLSFDTKLSQALARTFARIGRPADPRLLQVTISQLLAHRAGFGGEEDAEPLGAYLRRNTARRTAFDTQLKWLLPLRLASAPGTRHTYSNAGYMVLGAVIEEASGQDYESYCKEAVLSPLGARNAALDPEWRIMASYGGWRMPLADYGRFYQAFALGNPALGPVSRTWMMSPHGKQVGGGVHYGLGTFVRPTRVGGGNFWHWGGWTYTMPDAYDGPLKTSYSTFAVRWGAVDVNIVLSNEPALGEGNGQNELDGALSRAAGAVKSWP